VVFGPNKGRRKGGLVGGSNLWRSCPSDRYPGTASLQVYLSPAGQLLSRSGRLAAARQYDSVQRGQGRRNQYLGDTTGQSRTAYRYTTLVDWRYRSREPCQCIAVRQSDFLGVRGIERSHRRLASASEFTR